MTIYELKYQEYLNDFSKARKMVLSTSINDKVSSRMMSVVEIDGDYYFQTDKTFKKYDELINNPNIALCIDNIQIEGEAILLGKPLDNEEFVSMFKKHYLGSYNAYSSLDNEVLFMVKPNRIERWLYINNVPHMEIFEIKNKEYKLVEYIGK